MRDLGILPTCVVFNLGTNDLKGTTAAGLADAVDVDTVDARLQQLLAAVADVPDIFIVNLAADLTTAPSTMSDVSQTADRYTDSVISSGVGDVVDWAGATRLQSGLIGPDGIHDSVQGQRVRSALITEAVSRDCQ